ncbi:MAG TPA: CHAD domain-containing protein [Longimicrobiales bacterium]|nr:CHAD domain-containing protein [Longimicrobiales bacterium]
MTSVLLDGESLAPGMRRVALAEVDAALEGLEESDPPEPPLAGVHEVRRRLKRVRALLRLARPHVDEGLFADQNGSYRDLARAVAPARDAQVLVETLARIADTEGANVAELLADLRSRRDAVVARVLPPGTVRALDRRLRTAAGVVPAWTPPTLDWPSVQSGLRRSYDAGRRALRTVLRSGAGATAPGPAYHEWRKRAKDLRHQLEFLGGVWPPVMETVDAELHRLTDLLGAANDLVVLLGVLTEVNGPSGSPGSARVRHAAREARDRAWREAEPLGRRIWAEAPAVFSRRIGSYWDVWRT